MLRNCGTNFKETSRLYRVNTIQRYVLREILGPTGLGLVVFTFVFLIGQMFTLADYLLNSGIPPRLGLELILLILPGLMSITIPMAVLVGVLMGIGRLAADREILAIRASGVNVLHLAKPVVAFTIVVTGFMMLANVKLIPYLNLKRADLQVQILFHALSAIPAGVPFEMPTEGQEGDSAIFISSKDPESGKMQGVAMLVQMEANADPSKVRSGLSDLNTTGAVKQVKEKKRAKQAAAWELQQRKEKMSKEEKLALRRQEEQQDWNEKVNKPVQNVLILAEQGVFDPQIKDRAVYVRLSKGSIHLTDPEDKGAYDVINFDTLTRGIVPTFDKIEKGYFEKAPAEMSVGELRQQIKQKDKGRKYSVELYQRFSVPLACIAFALIAFPLAVYVRPTGKAIAFGISFLLILLYYGLLQYGVALGSAVAIFLPNLLIAGVGGFMLYRITSR